MAFQIPTLEQTTDFAVSLWRAAFPTTNVSRSSANWKILRTFAGAVSDIHAHVFAVQNDLLPDTATADALVRWGNIKGIPIKGATPARKSQALRVFGDVGITVSSGLNLVHSSTLRFQIQNPATVGSGGYTDCDVVAIDLGSATRLNAGETLRFLSTPIGLSETAELQIAIDEDGDDQESDGAYRARQLSRWAEPALGGAPNDYVQWSLAEDGIATAFVYPQRNGLGSVDVVAFHAGSGPSRSLLPGEVTYMQAVLDGLKPVGADVRVLSTAPVQVSAHLAIRGTGEARYLFDWDDTVPAVVSSWTVGTRTLVFSGSVPAALTPGDRIIFGGATATGEQSVIEAIASPTSVVLRTAPSFTPVALDPVYAGGPLVDPVRNAILDHFASLGPANPDEIRYGIWESNIRPGALLRLASTAAGVLDADVIAPVYTIEPIDDPELTSVAYLVPGQILVRGAH